MTTRNGIMDAFAALFADLAKDGTFKKIDRRFALSSKVPPADKPCLLITEHTESYVNNNVSDPGIITMSAGLWIYTDVGKDQDIIPIVFLNDLIDATMNKMRPNPISGVITLDGQVVDARVDGEILKSAGDLDGNGIAMIPIKILLPSF